MRRVLLLLTVMAAMLVMASGVALAATKFGGPGNDSLLGTNGPDQLFGGTGDDIIDGLSGPDRILGGSGDDLLFDGENRGGARDILIGGSGDDILFPGNAPPSQDVAICGTGTDTAFADPTDIVIGCERVLFRPPTAADFQ